MNLIGSTSHESTLINSEDVLALCERGGLLACVSLRHFVNDGLLRASMYKTSGHAATIYFSCQKKQNDQLLMTLVCFLTV